MIKATIKVGKKFPFVQSIYLLKPMFADYLRESSMLQ